MTVDSMSWDEFLVWLTERRDGLLYDCLATCDNPVPGDILHMDWTIKVKLVHTVTKEDVAVCVPHFIPFTK